MGMGRSSRVVRWERVRVSPLEAKSRSGLVRGMVALTVALAFGLVLVFVRLNSEQVKLKRQVTELRRGFGLRSKEIENLGLEVEMYRSGSRIFAQIQRLRLGLRMPEPGQVIRMRGSAAPARGSRNQGETELAKADRGG